MDISIYCLNIISLAFQSDCSLITVISLLFVLWHFFFHLLELLAWFSGESGHSGMVDGCGEVLATTMDQRRPRRSLRAGNSAIRLFSYSLNIK